MYQGYDLVSLGYSAYDFLTIVDGLPEENSKYELDNLTIQGGGPAATAAVTASRLGARSCFIGKVSDDYFGLKMIEELKQEGVNTDWVVIDRNKRSQFAFIMINRRNASRTILWSRGTVSPLDADEVPLDIISSSGLLLIDDLEVAAALEGAKHARNEGVDVLIDAGSLREGVYELLPYCSYIVASEVFAHQISDGKGLEEALKKIETFGPKAAVVTLGERGCAAIVEGKIRYFDGFEVKAVDTTGAGDVFHGAFAYGVLAGWDIERLCIFANAVAALKCRKVGGRAGIPDFKEAVEFINSQCPELSFSPYRSMDI